MEWWFSMSLHKATFSLDAILSLLPILFMVFYCITLFAHFTMATERAIEEQIIFDKLVVVGDYAIKHGLAKYDGINRQPNIISSSVDEGDLRVRIGLSELTIGADKGGGVCIYRLGVSEKGNRIEKVYICGG